MKKILILLTILVLTSMTIMACGASINSGISLQESYDAIDVGSENEDKNSSTTYEVIEPSEVYDEAMDYISSGDTLKGIKMLTEIPYYKDSEKYLVGYSYLQYYLGEWEADLSKDFEKGTTVFPYELSLIISDKDIWFDSEVNGFYRLRFPVTVESILWKDNKTISGKDEYDGYLLYQIDDWDKGPTPCIMFGVVNGGLFYHLYEGEPNRTECDLLLTNKNEDFVPNTNNEFYCDRKTEQQKVSIYWDKTLSSSMNYSDNNSVSGSTDTYSENDNSLDRALSYLSVSAFSKEGLIEQLEYEGFSHTEAVNAVNDCGADWNKQALEKAVSYLEYSAFSYSGLIEQLEYEGFTSSEAQYGVDNCGANWNDQAVQKAKEYLKYSSFSRSDLIDQLVFEGFTQSQAEYGVSKAY